MASRPSTWGWLLLAEMDGCTMSAVTVITLKVQISNQSVTQNQDCFKCTAQKYHSKFLIFGSAMLNLHWHHLLSCAYGPVLPLVFLLLLWDPGKRAGGLSSVGLSSSPCGIPRKDVPVQEPKCGKAANPFQITALQIVNTPCLFNLQESNVCNWGTL